MSRQLRVSKEFYATVQAEATAMHRKAGSQVEHWAKLGRLLEKSSSYQRLQAFMAGTLSLDGLSALEHSLAMETLTEEVEAFSQGDGMREHLARQDAAAKQSDR